MKNPGENNVCFAKGDNIKAKLRAANMPSPSRNDGELTNFCIALSIILSDTRLFVKRPIHRDFLALQKRLWRGLDTADFFPAANLWMTFESMCLVPGQCAGGTD